MSFLPSVTFSATILNLGKLFSCMSNDQIAYATKRGSVPGAGLNSESHLESNKARKSFGFLHGWSWPEVGISGLQANEQLSSG